MREGKEQTGDREHATVKGGWEERAMYDFDIVVQFIPRFYGVAGSQ